MVKITMKDNETYDEIDRMLSKAYFKKKVKTEPADNISPVIPAVIPQEILPVDTPASIVYHDRVSKAPFIIIICLLSIIIASLIFAFLFLQNNKVFFTVINTLSDGTEKTDTVLIDMENLAAIPTQTLTNVNAYTISDFENDIDGWEIPNWAEEKQDHVATDIQLIKGISANGQYSLKVNSSFPGGQWTAAYIELPHYFDLGNYNSLIAEVFVPHNCPKGLRGRFILTVSDSWRFVEMSHSIPLIPGKWNTITSDISETSRDWKRTLVDMDFKTDIRKIGIRIESDRKPIYSGPFYIDDVRAE
ncbi:MAG: hypothetical protein HQL29_00280 [Candidatus Omnitrophica bacterium]|nr:hypothetical protein [Candidatus Omnitrophota bacterium]